MSMQLSEGALATIMDGGTVEDPVLQILGFRKLTGCGSSERYRLLVSDGCHLNSFAMLATQLNEKITSGELTDFSVVRINRLITSMVNNTGLGKKRVMVILDLTVLQKGTEVGMRIGNPVSFPDIGSSAGSPAEPSKPSVTSSLRTAGDEEAKNKFKSLSDAIRRELMKRPTVFSGKAVHCNRNSRCYFELLMFLRDMIVSIDSASNMDSGVSLPEKTEVSNVLADDEAHEVFVETPFGGNTSTDGASVYSEEFLPSASTPPKSSSQKRKREEVTGIEEEFELEHQKVKMLKKEECEDTQLLLSFVPYMKKLDIQDKFDVRFQIINVFKNKTSSLLYDLIQQDIATEELI